MESSLLLEHWQWGEAKRSAEGETSLELQPSKTGRQSCFLARLFVQGVQANSKISAFSDFLFSFASLRLCARMGFKGFSTSLRENGFN
jgi:hypothetical protein